MGVHEWGGGKSSIIAKKEGVNFANRRPLTSAEGDEASRWNQSADNIKTDTRTGKLVGSMVH